MADSENEFACPEPDRAAVYGGCNDREGAIPPRSFYCEGADCPVVARANAFYGIVVNCPRIGVRLSVGTADILPFPANDNAPAKKPEN